MESVIHQFRSYLDDHPKISQFLILFGKVFLFCVIYLFLKEFFRFFFLENFPRYTDWEAYKQGTILLKTAINNGFFWFLIFLFLSPFLLFYPELRWKNFDFNFLRWLVFLITFMLALQWAAVEFNYYLNQPFYAERLLLLALSFFVLLHPLYVVLFLLAFLPFVAQYNIPTAFIHADFYLLEECLYLFVSFLLLRTFWEVDDTIYFFSILCLTGAYFFAVGALKVRHGPSLWGWPIEYDLVMGLSRFEFLGWLKLLPESIRTFIFNLAQVIQKPLLIGYFLSFFLLGPFLLMGRYLTVITILVLTASNIFYSLFTGIIFWQNTILYLGLIMLLVFSYHYKKNELYDSSYKLLSLPLIFFFVVFLPYQVRGFYRMETHYNKRYTFEVMSSRGTIYPIKKNGFQPFLRHLYLDKFEKWKGNRFASFIGEYQLSPTIDPTKTDPRVIEMINFEIKNLSDLRSITRQYGKIEKNNRLARRLSDFFQNYVRNKQNKSKHAKFIEQISHYILIPNFINTFYEPEKLTIEDVEQPIVQFRIRQAEALYRQGNHRLLDDKIITKIKIPASK